MTASDMVAGGLCLAGVAARLADHRQRRIQGRTGGALEGHPGARLRDGPSLGPLDGRAEQDGLEAGQAAARRIAQRAGQGGGDRPHHRRAACGEDAGDRGRAARQTDAAKGDLDHQRGRQHRLDRCAQEPADRFCRHARQHGDGDRRDPRLSADGGCELQERSSRSSGRSIRRNSTRWRSALGDDGRPAEGLRLAGCSPRQIRAVAAKNVRDPGLGPLEHGAMVPDQRGRAPRQQAARYLRGREKCTRARAPAAWFRGNRTA